MNYTNCEPLFIASNQRDADMLDIYNKTQNGPVCMWGSVHCDFLSSLKNEVEEHFDLADSDGLEIVVISREHYDQLVSEMADLRFQVDCIEDNDGRM